MAFTYLNAAIMCAVDKDKCKLHPTEENNCKLRQLFFKHKFLCSKLGKIQIYFFYKSNLALPRGFQDPSEVYYYCNPNVIFWFA